MSLTYHHLSSEERDRSQRRTAAGHFGYGVDDTVKRAKAIIFAKNQ